MGMARRRIMSCVQLKPGEKTSIAPAQRRTETNWALRPAVQLSECKVGAMPRSNPLASYAMPIAVLQRRNWGD